MKPHMKKRHFLFPLSLLIGASILSGQGSPKVGIVDVQLVFDQFERFEEARQDLAEIEQRAQATLAPRAEELQALEAEVRELEAKINSPTITEESKLQLQQEGSQLLREFSEKRNQFLRLQQETRATVQNSRLNMESMALEEISGAAAVVADQMELDLVLRAQEQVVLFFREGLDISDQVLAQLSASAESE